MNVYVDTSVLTAYYCPERGSDAAQAFLNEQHGVALSWLTEVEIISALSRKVRAGEISSADAFTIATTFSRHVQQGYYEVLGVQDSDYRSAMELLGHFTTSLRSLDALHVAVALRESRVIATADDRLAKAARKLGAQVHFVTYPK